MKRMCLLSTVAVCALAVPAYADEVFTLGEVTSTAATGETAVLGGSTVTQDDMREFNREKLDDALKLVPGATVSTQGARNETNVWIRGFDRQRVPLYQDGIPVYLPYDNRIDFQQFTTADIGEIQVSKGFTSVIDGPGAMGGSINMVSRRVTKPFEGEARAGMTFDQDGALNGFNLDTFMGGKIGNWYIQGSATEAYKNHFRLSESYQPAGYENGGNRNKSMNEDQKYNVKIGYAPDALDEYAINLVDMQGRKDDPPVDANAGKATGKFWSWPDWDKQSAYWLSKTAIDDKGSYVKTRLYYDRFFNNLFGYSDSTYTVQNSRSSFRNSKYDDRAVGAIAEVKKVLFDGMDSVRGAFNYRWDQHNRGQDNPTVVSGITRYWNSQPWTSSESNTYSSAFENTFHPDPAWDVITGISYDYRNVYSADDWSTSTNSVIRYHLSDKHAVNPEAAVVYHYDDTGSVHASVAYRTRFPTLNDMYSTRNQGTHTYVSNPTLQNERSIYWETGVADTLGKTHLGVNLYYARVMNALGGVQIDTSGTYQEQNVGTEMHRGFEIEADTHLLDSLQLGGNYSYMLETLETPNQISGNMLTNNPRHKLFVYLNWQPIDGLSVVPSMELNSKSYMSEGDSAGTLTRTGDFALANIKVSYDIMSNVQVEAGVKNLFDQNYQVDYGYHSEGRNMFTNVRVQF